jgi:hypothetical protein
VASFQKVHASANQPIRVFFHHLAGLTSQGFDLEDTNSKRLLNQFGLELKQLISRPSPHLAVPQCTLTVTLHKDLQRNGFYRILETVLADTLLSLDSFAGKVESIPIEYRSVRLSPPLVSLLLLTEAHTHFSLSSDISVDFFMSSRCNR